MRLLGHAVNEPTFHISGNRFFVKTLVSGPETSCGKAQIEAEPIANEFRRRGILEGIVKRNDRLALKNQYRNHQLPGKKQL